MTALILDENDSFCQINNIFGQSKTEHAIIRVKCRHLGLMEALYNSSCQVYKSDHLS